MKIINVASVSAAFILLLSSTLQARSDDLYFSIVPRPENIRMHRKSPVPTQNTFKVKGADINFDASLDSRSRLAITAFASRLAVVCGKTSSTASPVGLANVINSGKVRGFAFLIDSSMEYEEYQIDINDKSVCIKAGGYNGILYALQTLRHMLPVEIFGTDFVDNLSWNIPCVTIRDKPRTKERILMLDCVRHFFSIEETKRVLDIMAFYKLNRLKWHLTDDQGWRVEIKKYPELTQIGAFRSGTQIGYDRTSSDGTRYGGYYTQEQVRDVVAYAYKLGIEIIPEISIPGHMQAALAAFPQLGCSGGPYEVQTNWGASQGTLCAGKESTYIFLKGVLDEICDIFPYKYIDISCDGCNRDSWKTCPDCQAMTGKLGYEDDDLSSAGQKLQNFLQGEVQKYLRQKGKDISGPVSHLDLSCFQSEKREAEPIAREGYVPLRTVYDFKPSDGDGQYGGGVPYCIQADLWSEYLDSDRTLEYMLLPRLAALSEAQWSNGEDRDYGRFEQNLVNHEFEILEKMGYFFKR